MKSGYLNLLKTAVLLTSGVVAIGLVAELALGQSVITLPQKVIVQGRTELVSPTRTPAAAKLENVVSSNPSVARVSVYRENQVQVTAVAPGRSEITFFDKTARQSYKMSVWVEAPNPTGGGGTGYDPTKTQLSQVEMLADRTENITSPGNAPHNISEPRSSNPSVATARTNTADTIQVYSKALGDTWIEFADNGVTYQVHVWVRSKLTPASAINGPKGPVGPKPITGPSPKPPTGPDQKPRPGAGPVTLDRCLVGTWTSQSATNTFINWTSGGGGIVMTIDAQGRVSLDYSGMEPNSANGKTTTWRGNSSGKIATSGNRNLNVVSVESSNVTATTTFQNGAAPFSGPLAGLGNVLQNQPTYSYTCGKDNLAIKSNIWSSMWTRER